MRLVELHAVEEFERSDGVERTRRLVKQEELRRERERDRRRRALALAARQLERIGAEHALRLAEADGSEAVFHQGRPLLLENAVCTQKVLVLAAHAQVLVQVVAGILEDHGEVAPCQFLLQRGVLQKRCAVVEDVARDRFSLVRQKPEDGAQERRFARAACADDGKRLACLQCERHVVEDALFRHLDGKVIDGEEGQIRRGFRAVRGCVLFAHDFSPLLSQRGSKMSRSSSPMRLKRMTVMKMASPGNIRSHGAVCM